MDEGGDPIPGTPPAHSYEGPWFQTQLVLSCGIGFASFLVFSYARTRWPLLFAPRTKLKGFSPHDAHMDQTFFGWVLPTLKTSEFAVLQIVGLDAAVLLNFFKMSFYLFAMMSAIAIVILMPINLKNNLDAGYGDDNDDNNVTFAPPVSPPASGGMDWLDLLNDANSYLSLHLLFTYLFTGLSLWFIYRNYARFVHARQLFTLEHVHSIAARTIMVTNLPNHLRGERTLAVYFENMGLSVESVSVVREVNSLKRLLDKRTDALLKLESAWVEYLGNPISPDTNDVSDEATMSAIEAQNLRPVVPHHARPTLRPTWFSSKVDALEYLDEGFKAAHDAFTKRRRSGKFKATHVAFVTFEKMSSAQIATQTVLSPHYDQCLTRLAPEPRDIVWANMSLSQTAGRARELIVMGLMAMLLFFWVFPIAALAGLLSYEEIKRTMPWLGEIIDANEEIRSIVQNLLPSVAVISLNACLPTILEALTYLQGWRARSWVEYSLLRKYFLFLLVNVVFIFLLASTYWQLIRELAESPAKLPERLAEALQQGRARHFFMSYVILQAFGIMPLQLLNLGVLIPRILYRMFVTRTPRDFAELNAPPMINYGVVYPQAILIFVVTLLYSVIQPMILIFGALYFGIGYLVYKYKLLFVFYKPYESQGQAWPITFARLIWGVIIFQIFMTGIFLLKKGFVLSSLMVPLLVGTFFWSWYIAKAFRPLSKHVNLSSVAEVQRGEDSDDVVKLRTGHPVTWSQSNLNRRRYAQNDETLYVAPEDERTDYSQPPMNNWYRGVLNTGKRRYGHPALTGVLPHLWLPLKKGQTLMNRGSPAENGKNAKRNEAVVLTLRKRYSIVRPDTSRPRSDGRVMGGLEEENPWNDTAAGPSQARAKSAPILHHRLSFDNASGVIMLPEDGSWLNDSDSEEDYGSNGSHQSPSLDQSTETTPLTTGIDNHSASASTITALESTPRKARHATYYHHPEKRRLTIPGAFPRP